MLEEAVRRITVMLWNFGYHEFPMYAYPCSAILGSHCEDWEDYVSSGIERRVVWQVITNTSEESAVSIFK